MRRTEIRDSDVLGRQLVRGCGVRKGGSGSATVGGVTSQRPTLVSGLEDVVQLVGDASAYGNPSFCARTRGGALLCWGSGTLCGVGITDPTKVCLPTQVTAWQ